ncbi:MAG: hypothetical protein H7A52_14945 [Akkermansiaceae bacterium]|nr:hypothetical protein [Akkermansiaceae bacterium]
MNSIFREIVEREVGKEALEGVDRLIERLRGDDQYPEFLSGSPYRYGPSQMIRSELELLNVSDPRFGIRQYLVRKGNIEGMLNLRRLALLNCRAGLPGNFDKPIADCLLTLPPGFADIHVLKTKLWAANGECLPAQSGGCAAESEFEATPYVQFMQICGGMCAQASVYMATALLPEHAAHIRGISEISYYAEKKRPQRGEGGELGISGLKPDQISHYLDGEGLTGRRLFAFPPELCPKETEDFEEFLVRNREILDPARLRFVQALRAVVMSNFPVILPVDLARLYQRGVYYDEKFERRVILKEDGHHKPGSKSGHAVVLVGCGKKVGDDRFLINDPGTGPFLWVSGKTLFESGAFGSFSNEFAESNGDAPRVVEEKPRFFPGQMIPVLPGRVTVTPLPPETLWVGKFLLPISEGEDPRGPGLLTLRDNDIKASFWEKVARKDQSDEVARERSQALRSAREWKRSESVPRLTRLSELPNPSFFESSIAPMAGHFSERVSEIQDRLRALFGGCRDRWLWVERTGDMLWFHDAESRREGRPAFPFEAAYYHSHRSKKWLEFYVPNLSSKLAISGGGEGGEKETGNEIAKLGPIDRLKPSMITSVSLHGFEPALRGWPTSLGIEFYGFMHSDFDKVGGRDELNAASVERLAGLTSEQLMALAGAIHRAAGERPIHGFASFIPEFARPSDEADAADSPGIMALRNLCQLAGILKKDFGRTEVGMIEAVGGGLISGAIDPAADKGDGRITKNLAKVDDAVEAILRNLLKIRGDLENADLVVALEFEPGPLYAFGDWDTLVLLADLLEAEEEFGPLKNLVGFNLDIAHWGIIEAIPLSRVFEKPGVFNRIVHAHISDHHPGAHFADCALGSVSRNLDVFRKWLNLYAVRHAAPVEGYPRCSGAVSIEIEACRDSEIRDRSIEILWSDLLGRPIETLRG